MIASVKRAAVIIPLLIGFLLIVPGAQAQIGFAGGYGINVLSKPGFSGTAQNTFDSPGGFNVGMFYEFRFGRITLRPGMFYRQSDFDWELEGIQPELNPLQSNINIAEFPIDVLIHFSNQSVGPYAVVGPSFNFVHTDQPDLRQTFDREKGSTSYAGFTIGGGLRLQPAGMGIILLPEIRYSFALSGFLKQDYIVRTVPYSADSSVKFNSLTFRLGISLPSFQ